MLKVNIIYPFYTISPYKQNLKSLQFLYFLLPSLYVRNISTKEKEKSSYPRVFEARVNRDRKKGVKPTESERKKKINGKPLI
jgi:hypothetical protein